MLSKLAQDDLPQCQAKKKELKEAARLGAEFLFNHGRNEDNSRVYFALSADGKPVELQRKLFSECFFVMAMVCFFKIMF